jgi:hypothetical protein
MMRAYVLEAQLSKKAHPSKCRTYYLGVKDMEIK